MGKKMSFKGVSFLLNPRLTTHNKYWSVTGTSSSSTPKFQPLWMFYSLTATLEKLKSRSGMNKIHCTLSHKQVYDMTIHEWLFVSHKMA